MELEFKLAQCATVQFKCIIKSEAVIFLSFRKSKMRFRGNFLSICDVVELDKNPQNPL